MSKKTKKKTLIQEFQDMLKNGYSTQKVIQFLSCENASLIAKTGMNYVFSAEEREELYDFYSFFMEKYGKKTYSARIENWGQEPFIFRLTENLYDQDREQELLNVLNTASENIKLEAFSLAEKLLSIKKDKILNCFNANGYSTYKLPDSKISVEDRKYLQAVCAEMLSCDGVIVVRVFGKKGEANQLFSVRSDGKGHWIPVPKKVTKESHCTAPDGSQLEPEIGLVYTEISKW